MSLVTGENPMDQLVNDTFHYCPALNINEHYPAYGVIFGSPYTSNATSIDGLSIFEYPSVDSIEFYDTQNYTRDYHCQDIQNEPAGQSLSQLSDYSLSIQSAEDLLNDYSHDGAISDSVNQGTVGLFPTPQTLSALPPFVAFHGSMPGSQHPSPSSVIEQVLLDAITLNLYASSCVTAAAIGLSDFNSKEEKARLDHNMREKDRADGIRTQIHNLEEQIPRTNDKKMKSRYGIIKRGVDYIKSLKNIISQLLQDNAKLREEIHVLKNTR